VSANVTKAQFLRSPSFRRTVTESTWPGLFDQGTFLLERS
jgi:hypothetical protein